MTVLPATDRILILDFGSQVTQLIARRVREAGAYCEIYPADTDPDRLRRFAPLGMILSGGPGSVLDDGAPPIPTCVFTWHVPILGICYGQQALCVQLGGQVVRGETREFGRADLHVTERCLLFDGFWEAGGHHAVWMSHGDHVTALPEGFRPVAVSRGAPFAAIADDQRRYYGVQFHPEVVHTPDGAALIANFVRRVCGCQGDWTMAAFRDQAIREIREKVGDRRVICGLSGGVDSAVTAALVHEAIQENLTCIFVDTGLLREGEASQVVSLFRENYNIPLIHRPAEALFLGRLKRVTDPEEKRKIIGSAFVEVFEEEAVQIESVSYLAQGTLYPDVIESAAPSGGPSVTIKSHHNVGGLPEKMKLDLLEPLRALFKDEVRRLGLELGLPETIVGRHPFPGPGLAIRIPGEVTAEKVAMLRRADAIFIEEIRAAGLYDDIWQAFAVLLPVRSVGVMGDNRSYDFALALRAVVSVDGMTADVYRFDADFLVQVATRIVNEVEGINRVTYDITSKPPGTIEWE